MRELPVHSSLVHDLIDFYSGVYGAFIVGGVVHGHLEGTIDIRVAIHRGEHETDLDHCVVDHCVLEVSLAGVLHCDGLGLALPQDYFGGAVHCRQKGVGRVRRHSYHSDHVETCRLPGAGTIWLWAMSILSPPVLWFE